MDGGYSRIGPSLQRADRDAYLASTGGMGIGLTLARRLARLMDGDVQLDQQDAEGTRFVVRLPLAAEGEAGS